MPSSKVPRTAPRTKQRQSGTTLRACIFKGILGPAAEGSRTQGGGSVGISKLVCTSFARCCDRRCRCLRQLVCRNGKRAGGSYSRGPGREQRAFVHRLDR